MGAAEPVLLGVDVGNTNVKCVAVSPEEGVLHVVRHPTAPARRAAVQGGPDASLDLEELWRIVCAAIRAVLAGLAVSRPGARLAGIAVASTGCEVVLVDERGRQLPVRSSAAENGRAFRDLAAATGPDRFFRTTGYPLEPGCAPFRLAAMREASPADFARIDGVLSVAGYITYRLAGVRAFEPSLIGSLAVRDVAAGRFWSDLLEDIGVQPAWFGTELASGEFVGEVLAQAAASGLPAGLPVFAGAHDYLAAALAVQRWGCDGVLDVLGTWEIIATFHDAPRPGLRGEGMRAFVDTHVLPGRYSFMIEALVGPRIDRFRSLGTSSLPSTSNADGADAHPLDLHVPAPGDGPLYIPGPLAGPDVGSILGLGPQHSRADVVRSVLTGLVLLTADAFRAQLAAAGGEEAICAVGGGSANRTWMQLKSDMAGVPVVVPAVPEATACGAALLAGLGAGVFPDAAAASAALAGSPVTSYEPDPVRRERLLELHESRFRPLQLALSAASGEPSHA